MYQRLGVVDVVAVTVSFIRIEPSGSDPEHKRNGDADHLIREQEENGRDCHHHKHHGGRDRGFPPRRPSHLARLFAHLLQKAEGAHPLAPHLCRSLIAHLLTLSISISSYPILPWQEWQDSNLQPP